MSSSRIDWLTRNPYLFAPALSSVVTITLPLVIGFIANRLSFVPPSHEKEEALQLINSITIHIQDGMNKMSLNIPDYHAAIQSFDNAKKLIDRFDRQYKKILNVEHHLAINEKILTLYKAMAITYYNMRQFDKALEVINTILTIDSQYRPAINLCGLIHLKQRLFDADEKQCAAYLQTAIDAFNLSMNIDSGQQDVYIFLLYARVLSAKLFQSSPMNVQPDSGISINDSVSLSAELQTITDSVDKIIDEKNIYTDWQSEIMLVNAFACYQLHDYAKSATCFDHALQWTPNTPAYYLEKAKLFAWAAQANLSLSENGIPDAVLVNAESKNDTDDSKKTPVQKHAQYNAESAKLIERNKLFKKTVVPLPDKNDLQPQKEVPKLTSYRDWLPSPKTMRIGGGAVAVCLGTGLVFSSIFKSNQASSLVMTGAAGAAVLSKTVEAGKRL